MGLVSLYRMELVGVVLLKIFQGKKFHFYKQHNRLFFNNNNKGT